MHSLDRPTGITRVEVEGYKSIADRLSIELRPLTLLAGSNSSGKSSLMQPLLLLKQTLEAPYNPGALLLSGPHVNAKHGDQLLSRIPGRAAEELSVSIEREPGGFISTSLGRLPSGDWRVLETRGSIDGVEITLDARNQPLGAIVTEIQAADVAMRTAAGPFALPEQPGRDFARSSKYRLGRYRSFLAAGEQTDTPTAGVVGYRFRVPCPSDLLLSILEVIHLPGIRYRGTYPVSGVGPVFSGTFDDYVGAVVADWERKQSRYDQQFNDLCDDLRTLEIATRVHARRVSDADLDLMVSRTLAGKGPPDDDLVSVGQVGLGVSQVVPVVVALRAARYGQLVYIEQPELHLHPGAQVRLAGLLAAAAQRGVRVVAETHSALLLLAVQTLVAEKKLAAELVKLHWFSRDVEGVTRVDSADLDEHGAFGDWPEDFGGVALETESRFLDASERVHGP